MEAAAVRFQPLLADALAFVQRQDFFAGRFAHIFAERPVKAIVFQLFENVRAPA